MRTTYCRLVRVALIAAAATLASICVAGEIVIGQVAPNTGPDAKQARAFATGLELAFRQVNRAGGVNGNTFTLQRKEVDGPAAQLVEETRKLVSQVSPALLAGLCGDAFVDGLADSGILGSEGIAVVGYRAVRTGGGALLFNARASTQDEVEKIAAHLGVLGVKKWGLLIENGAKAEAVSALMEATAGRAGAALVSRTSYEPGTTGVVSAVDASIKAAPQAIILISSGPAAVRFIEQYRQAGGRAQLFVHSGADLEQLAREIGHSNVVFVSHAMQGVVILQVAPNPHKQSPLVAKELHDAARVRSIDPSTLGYVTMEGFITGKLIVEAARRQGARVSRAGFIKALESIHQLNLGGYVVSFKPGSNVGSRQVELTVINGTGRVVE